MNLTKKRIYLTLVVFALLFGFSLRFLFVSFSGMKAASEGFAFQKKAQELFRLRVKDFENFKENYPLYREVLAKIDKSFVSSGAPVGFIGFLEELASSSNLAMDVEPLNLGKTEGELWPPIGFRILPKGSFPDFLRFLEKLERSPWLVEIFQLNLERVDEDKKRLKEFEALKIGDVSVYLKLKAFSYGAELR